MNTYNWTGRNLDGLLKTGQSQGKSESAVVTSLFNDGITPVDIKLHIDMKKKDIFANLSKGKLNVEDVILFSKQMYTLTKAGVPIQQSLNGMEKSASKPIVVEMLQALQVHLSEGQELSSGLAKYPIFDKFYISMLRIGEQTGAMSEIFLRLVEQLEFEKSVKRRVKEALRYPSFVIIAMIVAIVIINVFVIPAFSKTFQGLGAELPIMTKILMGFSAWFNHWWYLILLAVIGCIGGFIYFYRTQYGKYTVDKFKLSLPIIGSIIHKASLASFARSFSLASRSGIPVDESLLIVQETSDNAYIANKISSMVEGIRRGENITSLTSASGMFTPIVLQMISIGEETGDLDSLLVEIARTYDTEIDYQIKGLSAAIEPILLTIIGIMVLVLALGVFMPMWDMGQAALHSAK